MKENPFIIKGYKSEKFFCDRFAETQDLLSNVANGVDTTLISPRKYGKTGLILHLFDQIRKKSLPYYTLYVDIYSTLSLEDFVKELSSSILETFPEKSSAGKKFLNFLKSLRPVFSYDGLSGSPQVSFAYSSDNDKVSTLKDLLNYLNAQNKPIVLAIDEFQQIAQYPEKNMEALLRSYIQQTQNLTFIFCGSKKHLMADIFANEKKPFYSSTTFISLEKISETAYTQFIRHLFNVNGRKIGDDAIQFILEWTRRHTYYTQQLCHTIFANGDEDVTLDVVKVSCEQLMRQGEAVYLQYRQMLTDKQWNYLIAVAKEGSVRQITASAFLKRNKIGSPSVSRRLAEALVEKGLLNDDVGLNGTTYTVSDVFFSHWMERL